MPPTYKQDPEFLQAALIGLQHTLGALEVRIAELRSHLGGKPVAAKAAVGAPESAAKKHTMSAAARKRIGLAYNAAKGKPVAAKSVAAKPAAAPKPAKRQMSPEGRARIVAATKKRWAAFRKAQQAPKAAAKPAARKKAPAPAAPLQTAPPAAAE